MKDTVSVKELAYYLDLTPRRVQQLAKAGILRKLKRGEYELVPCLHAYIRHMRELLSIYTGMSKTDVMDMMAQSKNLTEAELQKYFESLENLDQIKLLPDWLDGQITKKAR
ncbi:MAG: hypothetical protein HY880_07605 [Deltaproteobacteria bacterium]|nr:hypothetical protein [Deltaproteobacteria bacterium]